MNKKTFLIINIILILLEILVLYFCIYHNILAVNIIIRILIYLYIMYCVYYHFYKSKMWLNLILIVVLFILNSLICLTLFFNFFYPWEGDISKYNLNGSKEQLVVRRSADAELSGPSNLRYEKKLLFGFKCSTLLDRSLEYSYEFNIDEMTKKINNSKTKNICHRDLKIKANLDNLLDW